MTTSPEPSLPEHVAENRRYWDAMADDWVAMGERAWLVDNPSWGIWDVSNDDAPLLPDDMAGLDAIELGCGTGYVSAWMARRGATVTAIDNSERQLETARRLSAEHNREITWLHGNAEEVPCPDESFDFAISEYGAAIWCDPERWLPEAHRLLRDGGRLVFLGNHPLAMACTPLSGAKVDFQLHRSYFELGELDWRDVEIDPGGVEFNMAISGWFALFARTGFSVDNYLEPEPPASETETRFEIPLEWAQRFPSEQVWFLTKTP
ncbi:MAG: class I SAM-dependent methyltransferase [Acidimicrobiales bacterium]